jgi:hypothetical protein
MFNINADIEDLKIRERTLVKAFFSMNNHPVATPGGMSEEGRSYVVFFRETGGNMSAYIAIYLLLSGKKLFYSHSSNPFPERELGSVEEEAISFAEGLGAMLDEVHLTKMTAEEKARWIDEQGIFAPPLKKTAAPAAPAATPPAPAAVAPPAPAPPAPAPAPQQPQSPPAAPTQVAQQQPVQAQPAPTQKVQQPVAPVPPAAAAPAAAAAPKPSPTPRKQPAEKALEETLREETSAAQTPASKDRLEIIQESIKAGIVKPPKQVKKEKQSATGVVSREREALARLLASF